MINICNETGINGTTILLGGEIEEMADSLLVAETGEFIILSYYSSGSILFHGFVDAAELCAET